VTCGGRRTTFAVHQVSRCHPGIALQPRHLVDAFCGALEAFVFLQAPHQLGARVRLFRRLIVADARQQHARLHFGERRRHEQVLARQFQLQHLHQFDVAHVLACDLGDRNVEDVQILPPYEIQKHIQRPLECLEKHLERLGRDVQVSRHLGDGLTLHDRKRHFGLRRLLRRYRRRRSVLHQRQFRFHR
jgi:hypothetical protein